MLSKEYLAYTDKHISIFKPPQEVVDGVKKCTKLTSDRVPFVDIPYVRADEYSVQGYGRFIKNESDVQVRMVQWPSNKRPVVGGMSGGTIFGDFVCRWVNNEVIVINNAVSNKYPKGWRDDHGNIFTQGADYHPDGEQIFLPRDMVNFL